MRSWDRIAVAGEITLLAGSDFFDSAGECNFGSVTSPFLSDPMLLQAFALHAIEIDSVSPSSRGEMSADPKLNGERPHSELIAFISFSLSCGKNR